MRAKWFVLFLTLLTVVVFSGCGSNGGSGGSDVADPNDPGSVQTVGSTNCSGCHSNGATATFRTYDLWSLSKHFNENDRPNTTSETCTPCHVQPANDYDDFGRSIVGCEACHGGGSAHNGIGPLPYPEPGPDRCLVCHGLTEPLFHSTSATRNISDTHYDDPNTFQVDGEDNLSILEGYIVRTGLNSGCTDCHEVHSGDLTINDEWGRSGHAGYILDVKDAAADQSLDGRTAAVLIEAGPPPAGVTDFGEAPALIHGGWSTSCQRCHTSTGASNYLTDPETYDPANNDFSHFATGEQDGKQDELIYCWACHSDVSTGALIDPGEIPFANGSVQSFDDGSNVCMACHQGRESGLSVEENIAAGDFGFINRHYLAAAAILFGKETDAGFEYRDKSAYEGQVTFSGHAGGDVLSTCVQCHARGQEDHSFKPELGDCDGCHSGIASFDELGLPFGRPNVDYDGNGAGESFQAEIDGMNARVFPALQTYASSQGKPIIYSPGSYPYFFNDTNGNGVVDPGEDIFPNRYQDFDATSLPAAYNYHSAQDPCGDIHNYKYVIQTLYDTLDDLDDGLQNNSIVGTRP